MTLEESNLEAVSRWLHLYNTDVHGMIDECYASNARVVWMGVLEVRDRAHFHQMERAMLTMVADRQARIERAIAIEDVVVVEAVLLATDRRTGNSSRTPWCSILTFRGGLIVSDHTYVAGMSLPWSQVDETLAPAAVPDPDSVWVVNEWSSG